MIERQSMYSFKLSMLIVIYA